MSVRSQLRVTSQQSPELGAAPVGIGLGCLTAVDPVALRLRAKATLSALPRPFLRWAGSKQRLLEHLVDVLPRGYATYHEPFLGSGALFFLLQPNRAALSDSCSDLIRVYSAIVDDVDAVARLLRPMRPLDREMYYQVRARRSTRPAKFAADFLYLNRSCWNGLYRVNSSGRFNVPYGAPKSNTLPDPANLRACSALLSQPGITLQSRDFEDALATVGAGDLVFLDPPYVTSHNANGFVDYNKTLFSWSDQQRLASVAQRLAEGGASVIVTNANHPDVVALYPNFRVTEVARHSTLASDATKRRQVTEAILSHVAI